MRFTIEFNENEPKHMITWIMLKAAQILPYTPVEEIDKDIHYERKVQFTNIVELVNTEFTKELTEKILKDKEACGND